MITLRSMRKKYVKDDILWCRHFSNNCSRLGVNKQLRTYNISLLASSHNICSLLANLKCFRIKVLLIFFLFTFLFLSSLSGNKNTYINHKAVAYWLRLVGEVAY